MILVSSIIKLFLVYWVKFFKNAGFPPDVATRHAVVFSNNRIKPDMLPDLDKPSLKEMGITLMGDMIAILRYAKKVVEETTCERFLVDSADTVHIHSKVPIKTIAKKVTKIPSKTIIATKPKLTPITKAVAKIPSTLIGKTAVSKITLDSTKISSEYDKSKQITLKRKIEEKPIEFDDDSDHDDQWTVKATTKKFKTSIVKNDIRPEDCVSLNAKSKQLQKALDPKRTVFDRLGDSSVTSTTNLTEAPQTFNITGLGKDVLKRSSSVFNRLGNKDGKNDESFQPSVTNNGMSTKTAQGILKNKNPTMPKIDASSSNVVRIVPKFKGTMHADHELKKKSASDSIKQLVKTTQKFSLKESSPKIIKIQLKDSPNQLGEYRMLSV